MPKYSVKVLLCMVCAVILFSCGCTYKKDNAADVSQIKTPAPEKPVAVSSPVDTINSIKENVPAATVFNTPAATLKDTGNYNTGSSPSRTPDLEKIISAPPTPSPVKADVKKAVPILYYHAIDDNIAGIQELFVSPAEFENQMDYLNKNKYSVITFDQLDNIGNIANPVIITFDDGYEDNYTYAYPVLKKYNFKASIFLCTGFVNNPSILKTSQIKEMADLVNFQGHTVTHPDLRALSREDIEKEFSDSNKFIEDITGKKVTAFAYPTGFYDQKVLELTKKYYKYAVLNTSGMYTEGEDKYLIKRVYIPRNLNILGFERRLKGLN